VLISGATGKLGSELLRTAPPGIDVIGLDRDSLDLTSSRSIEGVVGSSRSQVLINAAAFTAVDRAEGEPELARRINAVGAGMLAAACRRHGLRLVHLSTDYVFGGQASRPNRPDDHAQPTTVYGWTKLEGERGILRECGAEALIVRSAWFIAAHGTNFLRTMLRLMREQGTVRVVSDQIGSPTSVRHLAIALWDLVRLGATGIHHWTDAGVASWYDLAEAVRRLGQSRGLVPSNARVVPISTAEYPTLARRPAYSVLDKSSTWSILGRTSRHWLETLDEVLAECAHA